MPPTDPACDATKGICVWLFCKKIIHYKDRPKKLAFFQVFFINSAETVIKINGSLRDIPSNVTVKRGFPMGNFVFKFMKKTDHWAKYPIQISPAISSTETSPSVEKTTVRNREATNAAAMEVGSSAIAKSVETSTTTGEIVKSNTLVFIITTCLLFVLN